MTKHVTFMTVDDAEHYTPAQRKEIVDRYLPHEREARARGIPVLGSGRVFQVEESTIRCDPISIPNHWVQIVGVDFGYDHPFGGVHCAWDRDADCFYVCKEYREREATPVIHAAALKPWSGRVDQKAWLPVAWPHDGLQHDKGSAEELANQYRTQGLNMLGERATFEDGGNGVEAGVIDMLERMKTGRWKVFSTCGAWFGEFRLYHRVDGRIVKIADDLLSASRYALMMKRFAMVKPTTGWSQPTTKWVV